MIRCPVCNQLIINDKEIERVRKIERVRNLKRYKKARPKGPRRKEKCT
jgi:hypothetical protein